MTVITALLCASASVFAAEAARQVWPLAGDATMLTRLSAHVAGEPVVAVGYGFAPDADAKPPVFRDGDSVITRLQTISAAASDDDNTLIPFLVRNTWVIAPATRQDVNPNISAASPLEGASRGLLVRFILGALTPDQIRQLSSTAGLAATDLSPDAQSALALAVRLPIHITNIRARTATDGADEQPTTVAVKRPFDVATLRLRATLANGSIFISTDDTHFASQSFSPAYDSAEPQLWVPMSSGEGESLLGSRVPALVDVPNALKPSDIKGGAYTQTFGLSGVLGMDRVLAQLSTRTGGKFRCAPPYSPARVFIGSKDIPCGDVMDGLALALTASWRTLGDTYVFGWDRRGVGAVQQMVVEQEASVAVRLQALSDRVKDSPGWPEIATSLPYGTNDALAPTAAPRALLYGGSAALDASKDLIAYPDMTPGQREVVQNAILGKEIYEYTMDPFSSLKRAGTMDDVKKAAFGGSADVRLEIRIPKYGWIATPGLGVGTVTSEQVRSIRARANGTYADAVKAASAQYRPVPIHAPWSGLMVPVLSKERLGAVLREMARCGFKTLFYPALYGGYATFPTAAFPLAPALDGADGLADAVAAAKRRGIAVVATIGTLSWRLPGAGKHWTDAHPDWDDRDVLGRTRLEWLAAHSKWGRGFSGEPFLHTLAERDFVRPREPQVKSRLLQLLDALAKVPGVSGVAFADWKPLVGVAYDGILTPPPLGFAAADRIAALHDMGWDPVDADIADPPFAPRPPTVEVSLAHSRMPRGPDAYVELVSTLLSHAKTDRADWTTYRIDDASAPSTDRPVKGPAPAQPNSLITAPTLMGGIAAITLLPIPSRADLAASDPPEGFDGFTPIEALHRPRMPQVLGLDRAHAILYDFRACPEDISDALAWLYPKSGAR
jgi:hypothetical protein